MFVLLEITAAVEMLAVAIPESLGLLVFGFGLVIAAVWIRSLLTRRESGKTDDKDTKKA